MGLTKIISGKLFPSTVTILGGVHGDETPGIAIVQLFTQLRDGTLPKNHSYTDDQIKSAQHILAMLDDTGRHLNLEIVNQSAVDNGFRYIDRDINRSGTRGHLYTDTAPTKVAQYNPASSIHEDHVVFELEKKYPYGDAGVVLDLHSTTSKTRASIVLEGGEEEANMQLSKAMADAVNGDSRFGDYNILYLQNEPPPRNYTGAVMSSLSKYAVAIEWGPLKRNEVSSDAITGALLALTAAIETVCYTLKSPPAQPFSFVKLRSSKTAVPLPDGYEKNMSLVGHDFEPLHPDTSPFKKVDSGEPGTAFKDFDWYKSGTVGVFILEESYSSGVHRAETSQEPLPNIFMLAGEPATYPHPRNNHSGS